MPESKARKKATYTPPPTKQEGPRPSPPWYAPLMVALFCVGLAYIVTYYVTQGDFPIPGLRNWNIVIGFGLLLGGFGMATRWK